MKDYILMHKNIEVALMKLDENDANSKPSKIYLNEKEQDHIPIGARMNNIKFINWWQDRAIPKTRQGAKTALQRLGYSSVTNAMINNLALSLNDCYWIKPRYSELTWEEVNLFSNDFVDAFGELTFNQTETLDLRKYTKFLSAVSQGEVQKKWCIDNNGCRYLVKGNYGNSYQQSINEIFASNFHKDQNFNNYTPYYFCNIELVCALPVLYNLYIVSQKADIWACRKEGRICRANTGIFRLYVTLYCIPHPPSLHKRASTAPALAISQPKQS